MAISKLVSFVLVFLLAGVGLLTSPDRPVQVFSDNTHCTTSTTYELIGPEYAVAIETSGGDLEVAFMARHWNQAASPPSYISAWFDVEIDGARLSPFYAVDGLLLTSSDYTLATDTLPSIRVPVAAGTHSVQWMWKTAAGELCLVRGLLTVSEAR